MTRRYPNRPWVGVGVVVWHGDRFLLVRRGRPPRQGQWSLPGGAQHLGETVFDAAIREVREEVGLRITPREILTVVDSISRDETGAVEYHYTLVEVSAEASDGHAVAADDVDAVLWCELDRLDGLVEWEETRRVIRLAATRRTTAQVGGTD